MQNNRGLLTSLLPFTTRIADITVNRGAPQLHSPVACAAIVANTGFPLLFSSHCSQDCLRIPHFGGIATVFEKAESRQEPGSIP